MTRESNPSIGADCHWSSPFPCGTPSTTSTMATVRASSFSATRCAVVAPTLPAPTTVILLTMLVSKVEEYERNLIGTVVRAGLAAHLRQRSQPANLHLQQLVLFGLFGKRPA